MAEKIRYSRKDLKAPDEFLTTFGRLVEWCKENRRKVIIAVLCVVALSGVSLGTRAYFQWQETQASRDLWPFLDQARELLSGPSAPEPAKLAELEERIATRTEAHRGTRAAVYGEYYLGSIAFHRGELDKSISRFREGIRTGKDRGILRYLLREGLGNALEAKGNYAEAAAAYREAEAYADAELKVQAQVSEARVLGLSGKKDEAKALYQRILRENPKSRIRDLIDFKLTRLE
jgi:tetratricopeptide (TPR) repeat protein